ncbi:AAA family ATPase [Streptomyces violaceus]|uniref:AAA family ATPase n=1 Tax=Streptomyces violaceus TaxID=1936 RepID=A0ABY9UIN5_STRVL|nr:ATP-binding protein [Streptomyces janthinus]WND22723.1 AAA family ATPase [Streptomyces janthinus]
MGAHGTAAAGTTAAAALGAGTTLTAEIRRVLARVDAHAGRAAGEALGDTAARHAAQDSSTGAGRAAGGGPGGTAAQRVSRDRDGSAAPRVSQDPDGSAGQRVAQDPDGTAAQRVSREPDGSAAPRVSQDPDGTAAPRVAQDPDRTAAPDRVGTPPVGRGATRATVPEAGADGPGIAPLDALVTCFGLTVFERDLVLLAAAQELEPTTGARCAAASGDPERAYPTFSLALAALDEPHWSALPPVSPLRRWRIVELDDATRLTTSRLRLDERILHFLLGSPYLDDRLHGQMRRTPVPDRLPPSYDLAASGVAAGWTDGARPDAPLLVELVGGDLRSRADIAAAAAARAGLGLYALSAEDIPVDPAERDRFARLWQREAILLPAALLLEFGEPDRDQQAATEAFLAGAAVPVVVSSADPRRTDRPHGTRVSVPHLDDEEQLALWTDAFDDVADLEQTELRSLIAQFQLPPHVVRSAAATVRRELPYEDELDAAGLAWRAGMDEARVGMDELGRRIEPQAGWSDLVLHERQTGVLREIVAHVRQRAMVHQEWGFAATLRRGLGVTALFAGGSGTGKTLAAEVMAKELGLDLFVIDLSQVVSKYIGETEKNLRRVFDAAERGGALLLFDEADALFGKRSEVKDSHDRYANLEVSYLLMRMEAYRGLAILTTNMKKALDNAFLRRIRFVVDFPFPAEHERAEIWRRVLPPQAPVKDIDPQLLAQLTVAGGSIRNIALSGAFLAAEEGEALQMRHMLAGARTEYLKLERSLTPTEVRGWV